MWNKSRLIMKVFGIILIILYFASAAHNLYIARTPEAYKQFHKKESEKIDSKPGQYIGYTIVAILNVSILAYLIYAVTCL